MHLPCDEHLRAIRLLSMHQKVALANDLAAAGVSPTAIANKMGVHLNFVIGLLETPPSLPGDAVLKVLRAYVDGSDVEQVAAQVLDSQISTVEREAVERLLATGQVPI